LDGVMSTLSLNLQYVEDDEKVQTHRKSPATSPVSQSSPVPVTRATTIDSQRDNNLPSPFAGQHLDIYNEDEDTFIERDDSFQSRSATMRENEGEWIESQEIMSGRHFWYNSISMEIVFENPTKNASLPPKKFGNFEHDSTDTDSAKLSTKNTSNSSNSSSNHNHNSNNNNNDQDGDDDDDDGILWRDIAGEHVSEDEIVHAVLKFNQSKWDFNNDHVEMYRIQVHQIDHRWMLPHPISMIFPEFFSTNPIPKKTSFLAAVLPPKDNTLFPTTTKSWTVKVEVEKTTAKQLIGKIVHKLKVSLVSSEYAEDPAEITRKSAEFIIKIVGSEEYILYDDTKFIIDYEAVRKAVRNEDDVCFQLDHRPDLPMIEQECFDKNIWHISRFAQKYLAAKLLHPRVLERHFEKLHSMRYMQKSYGDGKSMTDIVLALRHAGFTQPYQLRQHQMMRKSMPSSYNVLVSGDDTDVENNDPTATTTAAFVNAQSAPPSSVVSPLLMGAVPPPPPPPLPESDDGDEKNNSVKKPRVHVHAHTDMAIVKTMSLDSVDADDEADLEQEFDDDEDDEVVPNEDGASTPPPPPPPPMMQTRFSMDIATKNQYDGLLLGTAGGGGSRARLSSGHKPSKSANDVRSPVIGAASFTASIFDKNVAARSKTPTSYTANLDKYDNGGTGADFLDFARKRSPSFASHMASSLPSMSNHRPNSAHFSRATIATTTGTTSVNTAATRSRQPTMSNADKQHSNEQIIGKWKERMEVLQGREIVANLPSMADTKMLYQKIRSKAEQTQQGKQIEEMLFYEFTPHYRVKMSFLTNVTQLPRYRHFMMANQRINPRRLAVIVRHELWIGDLQYDGTTFETDYRTRVSDAMRLNSSFSQASRQKFCDLARESCISFTVFLCKLKSAKPDDESAALSAGGGSGGGDHESKSSSTAASASVHHKLTTTTENILNDRGLYEEEIPIAFARFPLIDVRHVLRDGKYAINLWPVPVFVDVYKGAKCDPYGNLAFRYRGTCVERKFKQLRSKFKRLSGTSSENNKSNLSFMLTVEFDKRPYKIIAPPLNHRVDYKKLDIKARAKLASEQSLHMHSQQLSRAALAKAHQKRSSGVGRFFGSNKSKKEKDKDKQQQQPEVSAAQQRKQAAADMQKAVEWQRISRLVNKDVLYSYSRTEKRLLWKYRDEISKMPDALYAFLKCVDWRDPQKRSEAYDFLEKWSPSNKLEDSLELLSYEYMDTFVREYAVMRIAQMHDSDLQRYLLQLVQCLKYELYHNNALIRLLMRRALSNPHQIGHFFFWHVKSEFLDKLELNLQYMERFGLYLEEYLLFSPIGHARDIMIQCNLCRVLAAINTKLSFEKKRNKAPKDQIKAILRAKLKKLNRILPPTFVLPINPRWRCTSFVADECKTMSSAQMPLWLSCRNVDDAVGDQNTIIMFKTGDDLRQDILTLQMLRVMDKIWLDRGLNLRLLPYNVVSTGDGQGMVEIVLNAQTTTHIHTHYGGGPQKGARDITTHLKYINECNKNNAVYVKKARDIYTRSCAGYAIAGYVLGLGDRHPSNIMVREKGELFHIDFAHFLGNFKTQNIIGEYVQWTREVAPFVFLPAYKHCIDNGNKDPGKYQDFINFAVNAYLGLRHRHRLLLNLFVLMLPSQMPELIVKEHINYSRDQLHLTSSDPEKASKKQSNGISEQDVSRHILKVVDACLKDKRRILDNALHAMKHT